MVSSKLQSHDCMRWKENSEDEVEEDDFSAEAEIMIAGTHLFVRCRVSSPHGCSISFSWVTPVRDAPGVPCGGGIFSHSFKRIRCCFAQLAHCPAEPAYRRQGRALEAISLLLHYATGGAFPLPEGVSAPRTISYTSPDAANEGSPASEYKSPLPILPSSLLCRISSTNTPSIRLFERLRFVVVREVAVWKEVELRYGGEAKAS